MMDVKVSFADGLIERTLCMLDKIEPKTVHKEGDHREKRSEALSEVKPVQPKT